MSEYSSVKILMKCRTGAPGWLSQLSVQVLRSTPVVIFQFLRWSHRIGLCAEGAEPGRDSLPPSLSAPPRLMCLSQTSEKKERRGKIVVV